MSWEPVRTTTRRAARGGLAADPAQDVKAVDAAHAKVEQDDSGQWEFLTVFVNSFAAEVHDGFFAGIERKERVKDFSFDKCLLDKGDVVLFIVDEEEYSQLRRGD
jgi:hypothetical protein